MSFVQGPQFHQCSRAFANRLRSRRVEQWKFFELAQPQRFGLQHDRGKVRPSDLGRREIVSRVVVVGRKQPHADTRANPSTATGTLVGAGATDRFDRQSLQLATWAVAADPRGPRIDDVSDMRNSQRAFGNVGGKDDATLATAGVEDALLLGGRQPRVERQQVDPAFQTKPFVVTGDTVRDFANVAFGRQENQRVARSVAIGRFDSRDHVPSDVVAAELVVGDVLPRQVLDLDRVTSSLNIHDRRRARVGRQSVRRIVRHQSSPR